MPNAGPWIALAALAVSLIVLIFSVVQFRRLALKDVVEALRLEVQALERKVAACEEHRGRCEESLARLERQNLELLLELRGRRDPSP